LEGLRVEQAENPAEGVVAGNPVFEPQNAAQQQFLRTTELGHVRRAVCPAQHRQQRDEQDLHQFVAGVGGTWIDQPSEDLLEFAHATPPSVRESTSESILRADATRASNPSAIPLPFGGGISVTSSCACA